MLSVGSQDGPRSVAPSARYACLIASSLVIQVKKPLHNSTRYETEALLFPSGTGYRKCGNSAADC